MRAAVFVKSGRVQQHELTPDGRHVQDADANAWHLVTVDDRGSVAACARYMVHERAVEFDDLAVKDSAMAKSERWGTKLRHAVESEISLARRRGVRYMEIGAWAIAEELRCSSEALRILLSSYALGLWMGGSVGISTAVLSTSAPLLRRIGGTPLRANGVELPPYFEPHYNCDIEILRFDSESPNPKFTQGIRDLYDALAFVPVIAARSASQWPVHRIASEVQALRAAC